LSLNFGLLSRNRSQDGQRGQDLVRVGVDGRLKLDRAFVNLGSKAAPAVGQQRLGQLDVMGNESAALRVDDLQFFFDSKRDDHLVSGTAHKHTRARTKCETQFGGIPQPTPEITSALPYRPFWDNS
jgi:hypothetical protein